VCDLETSRMGAPYIYDISRLRVKDLHSATYIYVVRRLRVNFPEFRVKSVSERSCYHPSRNSCLFLLCLQVTFPSQITHFSMNKWMRNPRFPFQVITSHKPNVFICMLFLTEERASDTQEPSHQVMPLLLPPIKKRHSLLRCRFLSSIILFYLT